MFDKCIVTANDPNPPVFTDTSGLDVQYDNLGVARISFAVLHKSQGLSVGAVTFTINNINYTGNIESIVTTQLEGSDYNESRVTFIGFGC